MAKDNLKNRLEELFSSSTGEQPAEQPAAQPVAQPAPAPQQRLAPVKAPPPTPSQPPPVARTSASEHASLTDGVFQDLFENSDILIQNLAMDGSFLYVNRAWQRTLGYTETDLHTLTLFDILHPDSVHQCQALFARAESGESPDHLEAWFGTKDGRVVALSGSTRIRFEDGKPVAMTCALADVTERRRAEEATTQLSKVVEQTADAVLITDAQGVIEYVNPAFEKLTGYTREEVIGHTPRLLKSGRHDRGHYQELWETVLGGAPYRGVIVNKKKNGDLFYVEKTITPLKDAQGRITHLVSTDKDITDRKQAEAEREQLLTELAARVEREQRLSAIAGRIDAAVEVKRVLQVTAEELRRATGSTRAVVRLGRTSDAERPPVPPAINAEGEAS